MMLINLKPLKGAASSTTSSQSLRPEAPERDGSEPLPKPGSGNARRRYGLSEATAQFKLRGDDMNELRPWTKKIEARPAGRRCPSLTERGVRPAGQACRRRSSSTQRRLAPRHHAARHRTVHTSLRPAQVSPLQDRNQYSVVMEAATEYWPSPETLQIPLRALAEKGTLPPVPLCRSRATNPRWSRSRGNTRAR